MGQGCDALERKKHTRSLSLYLSPLPLSLPMQTGLSIVNGAHDTAKLVELLEGFIKKYVQCYACGNPETVVRLKRDLVSLKCKACGAVSDVDARHKLNTYIINHPPEEVLSKAEKKLKKLEAERMAGEGSGAGPGGGPEGELGEASSQKKEKKEKKDKKKKDKDKKSKRSKSTEAEGGGGGGGGTGRGSPDGGDESGGSDDGSGGDDDDDDDDGVVWATDTSAAAAAARAKEQLSEAMAAMVTLADEATDARARAVVAVREAAAAPGATPVSVIDAAAAAAADAGAASPADRAALLVEALLLGGGPDAKLAAAATAAAPILAAAAPDAAGQMAVAVGVERALGVAVSPPDRVAEAGLVFKALYDADVLEEGIITGWAGAAGAGGVVGVPPDRAAAVRAAAAPFVAWLAQASSEEESELVSE